MAATRNTRLFQFLRQRTRGSVDIEDLAQETYLRLLRAGFDVDRNWRVALSVNNVFDKIYYEAMESSLHAWYGEPRNWMLQIDGRY
jgi:outer membrane receptor for ferric coprogen and ferric-rhodotorulic acid